MENLDFLYTGNPVTSISCTVALNGACSVTMMGHCSTRAARVIYTDAAIKDDIEMIRVRKVSWMSQRKNAEVDGVGVEREGRDAGVDVDDMVRCETSVERVDDTMGCDVARMCCRRSVGVVIVRSARIDIRCRKGEIRSVQSAYDMIIRTAV